MSRTAHVAAWKLETSRDWGRAVQWYVYPLATFAAVFLGLLCFEMFGRPLRIVLSLRHRALERMISFETIALPRPREFAVSSQAIHAYDLAVRNVREAQDAFHDLGSQFLALSESEPQFWIVLRFFGFNIALAGHALKNLSQAYAKAMPDSDEAHRMIDQARGAARTVLMACRRQSRDSLIKFELGPMYLRDMSWAERI